MCPPIKTMSWDFPVIPLVKTLWFQCKEHRFDPWSGNQDPTCRGAISPNATPGPVRHKIPPVTRKTPGATTGTWCSQIIFFLMKFRDHFPQAWRIHIPMQARLFHHSHKLLMTEGSWWCQHPGFIVPWIHPGSVRHERSQNNWGHLVQFPHFPIPANWSPEMPNDGSCRSSSIKVRITQILPWDAAQLCKGGGT